MGEAHARLGPSNHRWPNCPGSVREEAAYPDITGEAAIDGTGSHLLLEMCLQNNVPAAQYDQQIIGANHPDQPNGWLVQPDRIARVQMALDYITRRVNELKQQFPGCTVTVEAEQKSNPGAAFNRDDWWGTVDITITARNSMIPTEIYFIEVADYKDGRGWVSEKGNSQLISYLFGKMIPHIYNPKADKFNPLNIGGCRMTIIQPKTNPVIRYQCSTRSEDELSTKSVLESARMLAVAAHATDDENAPLVPGDHCQWCKANPKRGGHCSAKTDQSLQVVENMTDNELTGQLIAGSSNLHDYFSKAVADPKSLTPDQLSEIASAEDGILAVFDKVKEEIQARIEQGEHVPGYAMQPGRGQRVWNEDEETIVKKLKGRRLKQADIYPPKLITPAALLASDLLNDDQKKRIEKDMVTFKAGKLKLTKVAHDHKAEKEVAQSSTDRLNSNSVELMFAGVQKQEPAEEAAPSFF